MLSQVVHQLSRILEETIANGLIAAVSGVDTNVTGNVEVQRSSAMIRQRICNSKVGGFEDATRVAAGPVRDRFDRWACPVVELSRAGNAAPARRQSQPDGSRAAHRRWQAGSFRRLDA